MSTMTVLVVEDEAIVALDLAARLTRLGYEVVGVVPTGEDAVAKASESIPDAVLMDIRLKGEMDGVDAAMAIHRTLAVPIIFLTAYSDEATIKRILLDEPSGYLRKPVDERELKITLSATIRRARAMGQFRRGEEWLNLVLQNISDGVIATTDRVVRYINPAAERMTGKARDDAMGQDVMNVFRTAGHVSGLFDATARPIYDALIGEDGVERAIELQITAFPGESGRVLVFRDVGERLRAEHALRVSEERLRLASTAAHLGAIDFFPQTGKMVWDAQCRSFWGLPPDSEVNRDVWLAGIHPGDRERVGAEIARALAGERGGNIDIEHRTLGLGNGIERWVAVRGTTFFDESGLPARVVGMIRDVTERHHIEELRERLAGVFAHDLGAPLSAILMWSKMLLRPGKLSDELRRSIEPIARSADRMARMLQQMMDLTRAQLGGGMPVNREPVDLAALCREASKEVEVANPDSKIRCHAPPESIGTWDRVALGRVLSNLLVNAVQHGVPNKPVDLTLRDEGESVVIEVRNEGAAIPADVLPVLFDPFRRGKRATVSQVAGGAGGLGLGLFITKELVGAHGGSVDVRSTSERGTTFVVRLPKGDTTSLATSLAVSS